MLETMKAGLIGYGLAGRQLHAPLLQAAGFDLVGVVTSRAGEVAQDLPRATLFPTADALCEVDLDLIVIASPDHLHVAQARLALATGKHVVIDKPMAPTSAEAVALAHEAHQRGLLLSVFHNRRWDNDFLTIKDLIERGALGDVMHFAARWDRYRPEAGGGWREQFMQGELYGLGSHLVDQILMLFGVPDWLFADVYKQRAAPGQGDGFEILMGKGGLRISLGVNLLAADELRSYRVLGTKAAFVKTGLDPQEAQLRGGYKVGASSYGVEAEAASGRLFNGTSAPAERIVSMRGNWRAFYDGVRAAITGGENPVAPLAAARTIAMLEAALQSSRTGARIDLRDWLSLKGVI